ATIHPARFQGRPCNPGAAAQSAQPVVDRDLETDRDFSLRLDTAGSPLQAFPSACRVKGERSIGDTPIVIFWVVGEAMTAKIARSAAFFVLWVIIAGTEPVDLLFGIPASLLVASASLQLLPPGTKRPSIIAFAGLVSRFLYQS